MPDTNNISQIRKRDGQIVDFDQTKIISALKKALLAANEKEGKAKFLTDQAIKELNKKFHYRSIPAVEEVQDIVEETLIKNREIKTAKAYILYRDQHAKLREYESLVNSDEIMEGYLKQLDWRVKENSNMAFSLQGLNIHVSTAVSTHYWLNKIYSPAVCEAHLGGDIHVHDLYLLAPYCCGWDLKDLLIKGFSGVESKVECKPPKHFRTALGQVVNFFYTLQGEAAGAMAFSGFDTYLAPFIRYDDLGYKQVKQCMQEFVFNMNVPTRVGFQCPFTNITMDLVIPKNISEESVIIGGKPQNEKYGEFQTEMDMFNKAFAEVMVEGDAKGRVFTFPIPTYNISKDFNWDNPILDRVWEMTAKYGIPYFANFVNSDMNPEDARSMCCRLRLDNRELRKRGGGLFAANPLTGSLGVVTINLSRIAYLSKKSSSDAQDAKAKFYERLEKMMLLSKESLEVKRKVIERFSEQGLYPYSKVYLSGIKERFGEYWKNHFNTVGIIGMNEACLNLFGRDLTDDESHNFAIEVMSFMRGKLMDYQNEKDQLFNLEATPAEGASYRFAREDKKYFPDIIVANEEAIKEHGAEPYYTNSTHLPVDFTDDIFEALDRQDELQTLYTGGTVLHGFIGERLSVDGTKRLVKKIAENYHLPYYTITPTFSVCPKHGYLAGEHFYCPKCDEDDMSPQKLERQKCEVYSRVVGYIRPVDSWNKGKQSEFGRRKGYNKGLNDGL
ncbi:MAG: ribonucleoside triphosphate reductase [bacterium]